MDYHVVEARYVGWHVVWLRFRDGTAGEIDFESCWKGRSSSLSAIHMFRQFEIHPEFHTLIWANGADFAPEFLHDNVRVRRNTRRPPTPPRPSRAAYRRG